MHCSKNCNIIFFYLLLRITIMLGEVYKNDFLHLLTCTESINQYFARPTKKHTELYTIYTDHLNNKNLSSGAF